jgi:hypothetical protein
VQTPEVSIAHRPYLCLATVAVASLLLLGLAGCQTARTPTTVAPPATGMIGQPAQYGSWATPPQGAAYPASSISPPMPGPVTQWQGAAPAMPAAPAAPANSWSWSQPAQPAAPSLSQYGTQLQNQANQFQQGVSNQTQQFANQLQAQPQQYANQAQQQVTAQQQQLANQMQNTANQYQQGMNNQWQQMNNQAQQQVQQYTNQAQQQVQQYSNQAQQALTGAQQQVTAQMPQPPTASWNPFSTSATSLPPARATPPPPSSVPRY